MSVSIGSGGNQISRDLLQAVKDQAASDGKISGKKEVAALTQAALADGEITKVEEQFLKALGDKDQQAQLIQQLQASDFQPAFVDFPSKVAAKGNLFQTLSAGTISPALVKDYTSSFGKKADQAMYVSNDVTKHFQAYFQANPALAARMLADPAGERIHQILMSPGLLSARPQELELLLQKSGYEVPPKTNAASYDLKTHAAVMSFIHSLGAEAPKAAPAVPAAAPSPGAAMLTALEGYAELMPKGTSPADLAEASQVLAAIETMGQHQIGRAQAVELLRGMQSAGRDKMLSQLKILLDPKLQAAALTEVKQAIDTARAGTIKHVSIKDLGQVLANGKLAGLAALEQHAGDHEVDGMASRDIRAVLKARLMTYMILADAGGDSAQVANLIKSGKLQATAGFSEDRAFGFYQNRGSELGGDKLVLSWNHPDFDKISFKDLFAQSNAARSMRATIVHEASHALDDNRQEQGIRMPGVTGVSAYDPDHCDPGSREQVNLEGEFNAFYAEALYIARELKDAGNYSEARVLAALQRSHPQEKHVAALVHFIDRQVINRDKNSPPVTAADAQKLYDEVMFGLQHAPKPYERFSLDNNGSAPAP